MPGSWDIGDYALQGMMEGALASWLDDRDYYVKLFKNNVVPYPGITLGELEEATFTGYSSQYFVGTNWGTVSLTDHIARTVSTVPVLFEADVAASPQSIYGYYLTNPDEDILCWVERWETPRLVNPGDTLKVIPQMRLRTYPAS